MSMSKQKKKQSPVWEPKPSMPPKSIMSAKPAGPSFLVDCEDPYGLGVLRCLNEILEAQGDDPVCLPIVLVPDDRGVALAVLANYRTRCLGAGTVESGRLAKVEAAIVEFGGKL